MQKSVWINDVQVPIIVEGGDKWYPINYVFEKVLDIKTGKKQLDMLEDIRLFIKIYTIDMNFLNAGKQNTYCIREEGLKIYLTKHIKIGRYSVEQRILLNGMLEYLGLNSVSVQERFKGYFDYKKYNSYIVDCISDLMKYESSLKWQKCSRCNNYYPYHKNFFKVNLHSSKGFNTVCRECNGGYFIKNIDREVLGKVYSDKGEECYQYYKEHDTISIYKYCVENDNKLLGIINNKNDYTIIIKWLYDNGKINPNNLTSNLLINDFKINISNVGYRIDDIYTIIFGNKWREYPWEYPKIRMNNLTMEEAQIIFRNYINKSNVVVDDIYGFNYYEIIKECGLSKFIEGDTLNFIMEHYDNKLPAYKFSGGFINYWKTKEHRIQALKYFIEQDMNIDINKIPMYLTKMSLQRNARTLYTLLYSGKYYKNLFEWVNECYPGMYVEADFVINPYRDEFDSLEEMQIHNILKESFDTVIYNQRNTDRTIKVKNMIPDWIVFLENSCLLIEYFGLWVDRENIAKRNREYMDKTINKINKYKTLDGYKFIDLYPRDLENNYEGIKEKIESYSES